MAIKAGSANAKAHRTQYKTTNRMEVNRKKKLEKQIELQPNNKNLPRALNNVMYRRKTPKNPIWSSEWISTAKLFKLFAGRFDPDIMSANPEKARIALTKQSPVAARAETEKFEVNPLGSKSFFSLAARVGW